MASSVTHQFVSAVPDGVDDALVRPSDWNAGHDITIEVEDLQTVDTDTAKVLHPDGAGGVAWGAETGAPADAAYIVGAANGSLSNETVKAYLKDNYDPDAYPASPNAMDDEFEGGGSIDNKWTKVNDPSSADALNQTDFPGYLHVGLTENGGTDNLAAAVRLYQSPPAGNQAMSFTAKIAISVSVDAWQTEKGEFAMALLYLANSANSEFVGIGFQYNNANEANNLILLGTAQYDGGSGVFAPVTNSFNIICTPGDMLYAKLEKTTASAYTSSNTYNFYLSKNGIIWHNVGTISKTFTADCDQVGLLFRRPKSQNGSPKAEGLADFFRRIV